MGIYNGGAFSTRTLMHNSGRLPSYLIKEGCTKIKCLSVAFWNVAYSNLAGFFFSHVNSLFLFSKSVGAASILKFTENS